MVSAAQIDRICHGEQCDALEVVDGVVRFVQPSLNRTLAVGKQVVRDQSRVPANEAVIRSLRSRRGWIAVVSAFLDHEEDTVRLRVRLFDSLGGAGVGEDLLSMLEDAAVGRLFGGKDEILAITSNEEHTYNARTDIWFLPVRGTAKHLVSSSSTIGRFSKAGSPPGAGVTLLTETYDGLHAETKGRVAQFFAWDAKERVLRESSRR